MPNYAKEGSCNIGSHGSIRGIPFAFDGAEDRKTVNIQCGKYVAALIARSRSENDVLESEFFD